MDNPLIAPNLGLIVWQALVLLVLIFLLKKFAWKPILKALKDREESISTALQQAEMAKEEMAKLQSENEELLNKARQERDMMLKEARETREKMVADAKDQAKTEAERIITAARETIRHEKLAAIADLKNQVATLSIEVAEKIIKSDLADNQKHETFANAIIDDMNLN